MRGMYKTERSKVEQHIYDRSKRRDIELTSLGLCKSCMGPMSGSLKVCTNCSITRAAKLRVKRLEYKIKVLDHYGQGKCTCCGVDEPIFLCLDHIENDGAMERKAGIKGKGLDLYAYLIRNNFPPGYQVLCWSCNSGKHLNGGICPHQDSNYDWGTRTNPVKSIGTNSAYVTPTLKDTTNTCLYLN